MAFKKLVLIDDCDKALEKIKAFHANHHDPYSKKLLHAWSVIMDMVLRDDYGARDMYDALRSKRVYKDPLDWETTKRILKEEQGKQLWDPFIFSVLTERVFEDLENARTDLLDRAMKSE